jgi:gamma-D-glutamyl-L-lysine dipeptidyl-peptidase
MHAICTLSLIAVRKEPSSRSEMVTQVLFGELIEILDRQAEWLLIMTLPDQCEGWVAVNQVTEVTDDCANNYHDNLRMVSDNVAVALDDNTRLPVTLLKGSILPGSTGDSFKIDDSTYSYSGSTVKLPVSPAPEIISQVALSYINSPCFRGGRSPLGIDCSGFAQMVYKFCGIDLPRNADLQARLGEIINFTGESLPGDLAFFDNEQGAITHVGILLGEDQIIHASGRVKIDKIDHQGIFDGLSGLYTHKLRIIKRIF